LVVRQAIKGLFRPRNSTQAIIITLTASLVVIYSIFLIEQNLDATFIKSYPEDVPNLFFLDIQPSQLQEFSNALGIPAEYYPIVRARILSVNGEKIDRSKQRRRHGDNLARTFNLTYRNHLLEDETIIAGETLFRPDWGDRQVSILDMVAEINGMKIGDFITFKIQGIPLRVKIASIRSRTQDSMRPFFYFTFPESILKEAPQSIFSAVKIEPKQIPHLQTAIAKQFPNVSAIDVTATISTFAAVIRKLSFIIRFFTFFSIVAGVMIIISSILATRAARIQESVYFKILGARTRFVINVITLENLCLAIVSTGLGFIFSQVASWIVCRFIFDIAYDPMVFQSLLFMLVSMLLVAIVGWLPSWSIMRQKPVLFLRKQSLE
jgi:putative ABC transport system permease protein